MRKNISQKTITNKNKRLFPKKNENTLKLGINYTKKEGVVSIINQSEFVVGLQSFWQCCHCVIILF